MSDAAATHDPMTDHAPGEGIESYDLEVSGIVVVGVISTALVLGSALGVQALFRSYMAEDRTAKLTHATYNEAENLVAQQQTRLASARKIDAAKGVYAIPLARAGELVVREYAAPAAVEEEKSPPQASADGGQAPAGGDDAE